jgi:hypothetical protein
VSEDTGRILAVYQQGTKSLDYPLPVPGRGRKMGDSKQFDRGKFKEMVLYFAIRSAASRDEGFGMVKLNKLLYRADFEAYRTLGCSITGETYERQEFGPVARDLPIVLDELGQAGRLRWQQIPAGPHVRHVPSVPDHDEALPDPRVFSEDELNVMERTLDELATYGGKAASEWSHEQSAGWNLAGEDGNVIEYRTAFTSTAPLPDGFLKHASEYVRQRGWLRTS